MTETPALPAHLPGSERFLISAQQRSGVSTRPQTRAERTIARADEVSIFTVLKDFLGLTVPVAPDGSSWKTFCPWRDEHPDGGLDKGFRVYPDSNSAHCFVMHGYFTSSRLVAQQFGMRRVSAAEKILRHYDLLRPAPWWERFADLARASEQHVTHIDPDFATAALRRTLLSRTDYSSKQYLPVVRARFSACVTALEQAVTAAHAAPEDAESILSGWLEASYRHMTSHAGLTETSPEDQDSRNEGDVT